MSARPVLLLALLAAHAAAHYGRTADISPMPFVLGTRYGRSQELQPVAQRSDRFFMGSRYGKRSDPAYPSPDRRAGAPSAGPDDGAAPLMCQYTGVGELYRCEPTQLYRCAPPQHRRISDESGQDEEV